MPKKKKKAIEAAKPGVVSRDELKRLEKQQGLFDRLMHSFGALDSAPAAKAYLESHQDAEAAVNRTTAVGDPKSGSLKPLWRMQGSLAARNVVHGAAAYGRDQVLDEVLERVGLDEVRREQESKVPGRRRRKATTEQSEGGVKNCVNQVDGHGDTALLHASRGGHLEAARLLLERGALVDAQTRAGWASMHCAAQGDELEVLQLLYHYGGNPTLKTFNGLTPARIARQRGFVRTAEWIEWAEADWRLRHPTRVNSGRFKLVECTCSYCKILNKNGGDADDPRVQIVGAWREPEAPGYLDEHDPNHRALLRQADRRSRMPKKQAAED